MSNVSLVEKEVPTCGALEGLSYLFLHFIDILSNELVLNVKCHDC